MIITKHKDMSRQHILSYFLLLLPFSFLVYELQATSPNTWHPPSPSSSATTTPASSAPFLAYPLQPLLWAVWGACDPIVLHAKRPSQVSKVGS